MVSIWFLVMFVFMPFCTLIINVCVCECFWILCIGLSSSCFQPLQRMTVGLDVPHKMSESALMHAGLELHLHCHCNKVLLVHSTSFHVALPAWSWNDCILALGWHFSNFSQSNFSAMHEKKFHSTTRMTEIVVTQFLTCLTVFNQLLNQQPKWLAKTKHVLDLALASPLC